MSRRAWVLGILVFVTTSVASAAGALDAPTKSYFDNAFFGALNFIYNRMNMFSGAAWKIARILFMLDLGIMCLMIALGLAEVYKELVSRLVTLAIVLTLMTFWSYTYMQVTTGTLQIANIPVKEAVGSADGAMRKQIDDLYKQYYKAKAAAPKTYVNWLGQEVQVTGKTDADLIQEQIDSMEKAIGQLQIWGDGSTTISKTSYTVKYNMYLRPEALLVFTQALIAPVWAQAQSSGLDIGKGLMAALVALICFILACLLTIQYIIAMVEWAMVGVVGLLLLPTALWKGSKFVTEKLVATVVGHVIKIIVMYLIIGIVAGLMFKLSTAAYKGTMDQIIKLLFNYFLFFVMTLTVPQLAQSMMGGGPSLSASSAAQTARGIASGVANGMQTARTMNNTAGAMKSAGASAGRAAYHGAHMMAGALGAAKGAADAAPAGEKGSAAMASLAGSIGSAGAADANRIARSWIEKSPLRPAGGGGLGGGGGGIQDAGDASYQAKLNPDSNYLNELANPGITGYFNMRRGDAAGTSGGGSGPTAAPGATATSAGEANSEAAKTAQNEAPQPEAPYDGKPRWD